ncbi:hypothetical protein Ancab_013639 [Ancistrocladus abbreviatus]
MGKDFALSLAKTTPSDYTRFLQIKLPPSGVLELGKRIHQPVVQLQHLPAISKFYEHMDEFTQLLRVQIFHELINLEAYEIVTQQTRSCCFFSFCTSVPLSWFLCAR